MRHTCAVLNFTLHIPQNIIAMYFNGALFAPILRSSVLASGSSIGLG